MELEDVSCPLCDQMFMATGNLIPRLIPDNGLSYCTGCLQGLLDKSAGQDQFVCPEDPDTPIERKEKAEEFMKNIQMIRMADRYRKKQEGLNQSDASSSATANKFAPNRGSLQKKPTGSLEGPGITKPVVSPATSVMSNQPQHDLCPIHGKPMDLINVTTKERTCSSCALFGQHKGHDVRPEQEVLDQINLRTECLMEMYQMMETAASEKPNEQEVSSLVFNYKKKSEELRKSLKEKFLEMRNILIVQEQTTEAILQKNLVYIEKELKNLQSVDYNKFQEAEHWLKNAKIKLDNFQANQNNPNYIAFEMMIGADNGPPDMQNNDDFLLVDEGGKNNDIIDTGEVIAGNIGKFKCVQPGVLASQLNQLQLIFKDDLISGLNTVSKCIAIEGVEVSQEELEALREAAMAKREIDNLAVEALQDGTNVPGDIGSGMLKGSKKGGIIRNDPIPQTTTQDLMKKMDDLNIGGGASNPHQFGGNPARSIADETLQPQTNPVHEVVEPKQSTGMPDPTPPEQEFDGEFLQEIETYLKECMENNELSIDMSDTLIQDHGAKMVAAAASLCDQLQELRLQQCGITDDGAIELFNELKCLKQLQVIDISFNPITEKSLDTLTELLNANPQLVVNMRMNSVRTRFAARKMQHFEQQGRLNIQNQ